MIGADHGTQVFGIELCRERRRTHKVCEHDGELASLGVVPCLRFGWGCGLRRGRGSAGKLGNSPQHLSAMTKRNTNVLEVLVGEITQDTHVIDAVISKELGVLGHAELFEPVRNLLHRGHQGRSWSSFWATATKECTTDRNGTSRQKVARDRTWHVVNECGLEARDRK